MTSKEALQELFIRTSGCRDNEEYTTSRLREIIFDDLEILELYKKGLTTEEIKFMQNCKKYDYNYLINNIYKGKTKEQLYQKKKYIKRKLK